MAIEPSAFIERQVFDATMERYLRALRSSPALEGRTAMTPGDRKWAEAERRRRHGIPLDPDTVESFRALSERFAIPAPAMNAARAVEDA